MKRAVVVSLILVLVFLAIRNISEVWFPPTELTGEAYERELEEKSISIDHLVTLIRQCQSESIEIGTCPALIYIWSSSMPLSINGVDGAMKAASNLKLSFHLLTAQSLTAVGLTNIKSPEGRKLAQQLVAAGASVHYPTIALTLDGRVVGSVVAGHKSEEGFRRAITAQVSRASTQIDESGARAPLRSLQGVTELDAIVESNLASVSGMIGSYFQSYPTGEWLAYEKKLKNHAVSTLTKKTVSLPGTVDPVFSPDGHFLFTPVGMETGLEIYRVEEVAGELTTRLIMTDNNVVDQYPSVGILNADYSNNSGRQLAVHQSRYRVLTSWYDSAKYQDYLASFDVEGELVRFLPVGQPTPACDDKNLSLPILSPNGLELAARDEASGTTKLFRILPDGDCEKVLDLGLSTGKIGFSPDGSKLAFFVPRGTYGHGAGIAEFPDSRLAGSIFVLNRKNMTVRKVRITADYDRIVFPIFRNHRELVVLDEQGGNEKESVFTSLCCFD